MISMNLIELRQRSNVSESDMVGGGKKKKKEVTYGWYVIRMGM